MNDIRGTDWYKELLKYFEIELVSKANDIAKHNDVEYREVNIKVYFSRRGRNTIKVSYPTSVGQKSDELRLFKVRDDD